MDRYEEAMSRCKQWEREHTKGYVIQDMIEFIFPELRESEDERIRKGLVEFFNGFYNRFSPRNNVNVHWEGLEVKKVIAYLEKQKEQKPAESDSIKGGDFISDGKRVFLVLANVEERNLGETGSTFCESLILGVDGVVYCDGDDFKKYNRANSDERAKFIHDLKCGVIKERPAEWSEEDESKRSITISFLTTFAGMTDRLNDDGLISSPALQGCVDWLKSLRSRLKSSGNWKPSEEQMKALCSKLPIVKGGGDKIQDILETLYDDLKKLM